MAQILVIVGLSLALAVMIALYVGTPALLNQHWGYACRPSVLGATREQYRPLDGIRSWRPLRALEVPKVLVEDLRKFFCQLLISNKDTSS